MSELVLVEANIETVLATGISHDMRVLCNEGPKTKELYRLYGFPDIILAYAQHQNHSLRWSHSRNTKLTHDISISVRD